MSEFKPGDPVIVDGEEATITNVEPLTVLTDDDEKEVDSNSVSRDWGKT